MPDAPVEIRAVTFSTARTFIVAMFLHGLCATAAATAIARSIKGPVMSKPPRERTRMGAEGVAFCIARTLIERDPSLKAPMRANLRKMWELLEQREDHAAADMVDTMIKALNDPAFFKP